MGGIRRRQHGVSLLRDQLWWAETGTTVGSRCRYGLQEQRNNLSWGGTLNTQHHPDLAAFVLLNTCYSINCIYCVDQFWVNCPHNRLLKWILEVFFSFFLKCNQVSLHTHSGGAEPVWAWSCWRRTPKSSLRSRLLNPQQVLFTSAENALNLLVQASPSNSKTRSWLLFAILPPAPPASSSSMAFLCGAGATIAFVLLALVGAVVCSRTSKPTAYTVCS